MISRFFFIFLIFSITFIFPQNVDIKILSSTSSQLILEYSPIYSDTSIVNVQNKSYRNVKLHNGISNDNRESWGLPDIQKRYINIGVPSETGNTIQVLNYDYYEIDGRIIPISTLKKFDGLPDYEIIENENYSLQKDDEELVNFSDYRIVRGLPIQSIVISPIKFFPFENKIRLAKKIVVKITFGPTSVFSQPDKNDFRFNSQLVINYDVAKYWVRRDNELQKKKEIINSVLANGRWFRFEAPEEGIYIIRKEQLSSLGIDPNTVDPRTIKIYNGGGKPIPENFNTPRPNDLLENAIYVFGEEDGKFDDGDYILFYGRGTDIWDYDSLNRRIARTHNPYSKENYYWITSGGASGKRIQMQQSLNNPDAIIQSTSKAFAFWEEDKINIGKSGRHFVGDEFSSSFNSRTYITNLEGLIPNSKIDYRGQFINSTFQTSNTINIDENNQRIFSQMIYGKGDYSYGIGLFFNTSFTGTLPENRSVLKFTFSINNPSSFGYLNYFEIFYDRYLKVENDFIIFYSPLNDGVIEYQLSNFSNSDIKVFDITDFSNVKLISSPTVLSGGDYHFQANGTSNKIQKYLALCTSKYKTPINPVEVPNQNIHGVSDGYEYVIITNKVFKEQAERLRNYRENESKIKRKSGIFYVDEIFNEFSYGMVDPMGIRDFLKYAYENWQTKPFYVLFFGDGNYDYKNIEGKNKNFVIPAETEQFLDELYSYPTDDFYLNINQTQKGIDLTSGRLNVNTLEEAKVVIDKIIQYENNNDRSSWRNLITFVADDGKKSDNSDDGATHTWQTDTLARYYIPKSFEQNKIYLAAYPTVITSLGRRKPEVNQAIIDAINNGTVIMNFIGHGAPDLWTHERVFVQSVTIPQLHNKNYFFLIGATCDFSYWDKIDDKSSAEDLMLLPNGGTIGVFSATRPVVSGDNYLLNREFYKKLFNTKDSLSLPPTLGEVYFLAKNESIGLNDNSPKFNILGDPAIILNFPEYPASIDSVNGISLKDAIQVKALSKVNIKGQVKKSDNTNWDDFNGEGILTVYDSQKEVYLPEIRFNMLQQGGILYKSKISITNGKFNTEFVVPKDISYENKKGKIVFYYYNEQYDGVGYSDNIIVGGTDTTVVNDNKGPQIEIFFDNSEYNQNYLLTPNSTLIAKLNDETGLNATGLGIGHKMEAILNDDETKPIDLTNYFTGDLNSGGKSGQINYKFNNLEFGEYKIQIKAWDVFNNSSVASEYFKVVSGNELIIDYVMNYPNPFSSNTTFTFQQNLDVPIDVKIRIYTVAGRLIQELEENNLVEKFVKIPWEGRDRDGNQLANGVYLYKLSVSTIDGKYKSSSLGKLAIVR